MSTPAPPDRKPAARSPAPPSPLAWLLEALVLMALFFSVLAFFGAWNCYVDLLAHFRPQYALALLIAAALALLLRTWRAAGFAALGLAINAAVIVPLFVSATSAAIDETIPPLKVVSFNVRTSNRQFDAAAEYLLREQAEVVLLMEVDQTWLTELATRLHGYRMVEGLAQDDNFGIALFTRLDAAGLAVKQTECFDITGGAAEVKVIAAQLQWHDQPLALLGIHPVPPMTERNAAARDAVLAAAGRWSLDQQAHGKAAIVIGDFNATPWSHAFRQLEQEGNLLNSQRGFGVQPTYRSNWPQLLGISIDHCLHSKDLKTMQRVVDPQGHGSDHRPLAVTLGWVE